MHRILWGLIASLLYVGLTPAHAVIILSNTVTNDTKCAVRAAQGEVSYIGDVGNGCFNPAKPADVQHPSSPSNSVHLKKPDLDYHALL